MSYNHKLLDIKYALINAILLKAKRNLLNISFSINNENVNVQVFILEGSYTLSNAIIDKAVEDLKDYNVTFNHFFISKIDYNKNQYKNLDYILFLKAEL